VRTVKEVKRPILERRTEYYALLEEPADPDYIREYGPAANMDYLIAGLTPGRYTIVTKVKEVVISEQ
jgi:hypothetical protein